MVFETLVNNSKHDFERNPILEGRFVEATPRNTGNGDFWVVKVLTSNFDEVTFFAGSAAFRPLMEKLSKGAIVKGQGIRVEYRGLKPTKNGTMKDFVVQLEKVESPEDSKNPSSLSSEEKKIHSEPFKDDTITF